MSTGVTTSRLQATSADNPWPGLLPFSELDEHHFQGRETETDELHRLVARERLTVLFSLSGLGKSSLLQAGLFPRLRREQILPVYIRLDFAAERPDHVAQVRAAIAREGVDSQIEMPLTRDQEALWEYFHRVGNSFWNARNRPVLPLLVFDQFEELFTLGRLDGIRRQASADLIEQLADLAEGRPPAAVKARLDEHPGEAASFSFTRHHYKLLFAIREDFLADLEALRTRMPAVALNRLRLRRMRGDAALRVVNQAPHLIDEDVAERVVRFVAADRHGLPLGDLEVEPALLSVVCRELNTKRGSLGEPKITAGLLEGSQEQVLADLYERSMSGLPHEMRRFVEDHLLTVSGFRDSVALENALATPGISAPMVEQLVEQRLIRREERGGVQRLELTHDLLSRVVRASRDTRRQQEAAEQQRQALAAANAELERQRKDAERDRRNLRRTRIAGAVFAVLAIIAVAATYWAVDAQRRAQAALDETLARLQFQLGSVNGELAASALDVLSRQRGDADALRMIPPQVFTSNRWFANVSVALEQLTADDVNRVHWARAMLQQLFARLRTEMRFGPPPAADLDRQLNRRISIARGTFMMGFPITASDMAPPHAVHLSAFQIQEHEVTNGEYRRLDPTHDTGAPDHDPVVRVSWHDAFVYATWLGGALPTEAQWEFAARGQHGRPFPWGTELPTCDRANFVACGGKVMNVKGDRGKGATPEGVHDLAGNVWEWSRDWYGSYPEAEQSNPLGPRAGTTRMLRGGSYENDPRTIMTVYRAGHSPDMRLDNVGFRVAWPATGADTIAR